MLGWIGQILAPILVFGLVVFVHELGHFLAAKRVGVYAPRFSIGFGPALWKRKWGETEYVLAAIPLGGYVRMASREDETMAMIEGGSEAGQPIPAHRFFESKSLAARLLIMFAGVTMNVVLGFVVFTALALYYGRTTLAVRVVGEVQPVAAAPQLAISLSPGDTILAVDGKPVEWWDDIQIAIASGIGDSIRLRTNRGDFAVGLTGPEPTARRRVLQAILYDLPPVVGDVLPGRPAARAGLQSGDSIVAVAGERMDSWSDVVKRIEGSPGADVPLTIARGPRRMAVIVRPDSARSQRPGMEGKRVGRIGVIGQEPQGHAAVTASEAVALGWWATQRSATVIFDALKDLGAGKTSINELGGPIAIVRESSAAAKHGIERLLQLLALLSINVAIFNLLPIPILDGGQIVLNVLETIKGSAFSDRTREYIMRFGLATIGLLFAVVMFNDLKNLLGGLVNRLLGS